MPRRGEGLVALVRASSSPLHHLHINRDGRTVSGVIMYQASNLQS